MKYCSIGGRFETLIIKALELGPASSKQIEARVLSEGWRITPDVRQIGILCKQSPKVEKDYQAHNGMVWKLKEE
jgi:hypothetical protein